MRDNDWLKEKLENIWATYFANVSRVNEVAIEFGRNARTRLGSIKQIRPCHSEFISESHHNSIDRSRNHSTSLMAGKFGMTNSPSVITITGYFKDERVPEFMIDAVIAHELCHYAHGFSSPHPQLLRHPHQGGAVDREMIKRGMGDMLLAQQKWLKIEWKNIIGPVKRRQAVRRRRKVSLLKFLMSKY